MLPQIAITPERGASMDTTLPIGVDSWSLFTRAEDSGSVTSLADLGDRRVAVQSVNTGRRLAERHGGLDLLILDTMDDVVDALIDGRAKVVLHSTKPMRRLVEKRKLNDRIVEIEPPVTASVRAPALRFGLASVRERLNGAIPGYIISERHHALWREWFGAPRNLTKLWLLRAAAVAAALGVLALAVTQYVQRSARRRERAHYYAQIEAANAHLDRKNAELAAVNTELAELGSKLDY